MIRALIADDQSLVRTGFHMILEAEEDIEVVGEAADGTQAVDSAARLKPALLGLNHGLDNRAFGETAPIMFAKNSATLQCSAPEIRMWPQLSCWLAIGTSAFRAGERTNDAAEIMRTISARLNDTEIAALASYVFGLR